MQHHRWFFAALLILFLETAMDCTSVTAQSIADTKTTNGPHKKLGQVGPWNLDEQYQVPSMRWLDQRGAIHSLLYSGQHYQGKETEVFAFYASPATLDPSQAGKKFPGIVLIHGGGGTAFAEWVYLWAKRGYAAIAMDLSGSRPMDPVYDEKGVPKPGQTNAPSTRQRLPNGGPDQGHPEKFDTIGGDVSDDWPWHAVANVIRAHSWLRSYVEVDSSRTAVTGISWGGYTTCLVASLDERFQAAVPVYGCGFLYEGESVQKPAIDKLGDRREAWIRSYDPSSWLPRCKVPILWVNGTNDVHYPLDSYQKSFEVVPGKSKWMRIEVQMRHSHPAGWAPAEIGYFVDSFCGLGESLPNPGDIVINDDSVQVAYQSRLPLKEAAIHYTLETGLRSQRNWMTLSAQVSDQKIVAPKLPAQANTWFVSMTDVRGAMVTTPIRIQSAP